MRRILAASIPLIPLATLAATPHPAGANSSSTPTSISTRNPFGSGAGCSTR